MRRVGAILWRDARLSLSYPMNFWMQWGSIFVTIVGFWFVSRLVPPSVHLGGAGGRGSYFDYVVINIAFFSLQATALTSFSKAIRTDQLYGTIEPLMSTPTPLPLLVCAGSLWPFVITLLQLAWYLTIASTIFGLPLHSANIPLTIAVLALIIASSAGVGIFSAAAMMRFKQNGPSTFLVGGAASLLSGVLFPVALFPLPLRVVAWMLPITHGLTAVRLALAGGTWRAAAGDVIWLLCAALILVPLGLLAFRAAVERARIDGSLGHY